MNEEQTEVTKRNDEMTDEEKRERVIRLAFGGNPKHFAEFCEAVRSELPEGTGAVLRGSAVTGVRHADGAPFDADGEGTSDLDLTLVGAKVINLFNLDGFYVPMIHSRPLSDKDPQIAPTLIPLREKLQRMVNRPVNIQATRDFVMYLRGDIIGQPYLTLIEKTEEGETEATEL